MHESDHLDVADPELPRRGRAMPGDRDVAAVEETADLVDSGWALVMGHVLAHRLLHV